MKYSPDISYLLKEEHVLLLNSALTVEKDKSGSHQKLWEPFMNFFFTEIINKFTRGLPIILIGKDAQKYEKIIAPFTHYVKCVEHPAAASYQNRKWDCQSLFSETNRIIEQNNGKEGCIKWFREEN